MIGQTVGAYTIERELGRGGMGTVYSAIHNMLGRRAAVKVLLSELSGNQEVVQRFFNEARAATAIKHPSIVEVYDFGWAADGSAYIVMELMDGEPLASRLERAGRLPLASALTIARQIATALAAAHKANIVHRDLKPDNVFLVPDPEVIGGERTKLLDFGIAKLVAEGVSRTSTSAVFGTPLYMAPEQCQGAKLVDGRSDLYSLGCMLFEMIAGRPPFVSDGAGELIGMHQFVAPPALSTVAPSVPPEVEALVGRLLAKAPADRYQHAEALAIALGQLGAASASMVAATPSNSAALPRVAGTQALGTAAVPSSPIAPRPGPHPITTLSQAVVASTPPVAGHRTGLFVGVGGLAAVGAVVAIGLAVSGGGHPAAPADARLAGAPILAEGKVDVVAPPPKAPPPTLAERVEVVNPFVTIGSPPVVVHKRLVSREAYGWYLDGLPPGVAGSMRPIKAWSGSTRPSEAVTWVTFEQAQAFCAAIDGELPTSERWSTFARDPSHLVTVGPASEWTGTVEDNLALVREPADRGAVPEAPFLLSTQASAGANPRPESVARATVSFRCVR